ncbi:hypothetical protein PJE062_453 [Pseudovibrio sp. JE062]|nr:hypothetical protein PJE062_453 [Pseudovibrio sp. JE062]
MYGLGIYVEKDLELARNYLGKLGGLENWEAAQFWTESFAE